MRIGAGFNSIYALPSSAAAPPVEEPLHDAWHSPVPYLFGGLAAMLGLIAFALLILACSYWRLSNYLEEAGENNSGDRGGDGTGQGEGPPACFGQGFVVILAGDHKPTLLATPISSRASSFGDNNKGGKDTAPATAEDGKAGGDLNPEP